MLDGTDLKTADAGGTISTDLSALIDDADADPTNEFNTSVTLDGNDLKTTDAGGTITTDLSALVDDADADPTNEYITSVTLDGTDLKTTDGGGTITTDLSSLVFTGGSGTVIGDVKQGFQPGDHSGWVMLDGRDISTLTSAQQANAAILGFAGSIPDASGKVLKRQGSILTNGGSNTQSIQQTNLPNYTLLGSTNSNGSHSHTGNTNSDNHHHSYSGNTVSDSHNHSYYGYTYTDYHSHNSYDNGYYSGDAASLAKDNGLTSACGLVKCAENYQRSTTSDSHSHYYSGTTYSDSHYHGYSGTTYSDSHSHTLSVNAAGNHSHDLSLDSGGSNVPMNVENAYLSVNAFVYLGE